ncbi:MAG: hypothetical protein ACLSAF_23005 [Intestinimonas sp.]
MSQAAASADQKDWLQCDNEVDIQAGDELIIHRGAVLGKSIPGIRAFASGPNHFLSPSGLSCRDWPTRKSVCSSRSG